MLKYMRNVSSGIVASLAITVSLSSETLAYTIKDGIGKTGQSNIVFNWTDAAEDDGKSKQSYMITVSKKFDDGTTQFFQKRTMSGTDGQGNPSMFDFQNLFPLGLEPGNLQRMCITDPKCIGYEFDFMAPSNATDWRQEVFDQNGKSVVYGGNIKQESPWEFQLLSELPNIPSRIPDLAPFEATSDLAIYTAVNLELYLNNNPNGFLNGNWSVGQTLDELGLSIINGQILGLQGIYFSTTDFTFDANSDTGWIPINGDAGWLNSDDFQQANGVIGIIAEHDTVPEPTSTLSLLSLGILGAGATLKRKVKRSHYIGKDPTNIG